MDMDNLQHVSIADHEDCKPFITLCVQAHLDDLSEPVVYTSSPPGQLISDDNRFYEVPVPRTPSSDVGPSPIDLDPNAPSTSCCSHIKFGYRGRGRGRGLYPPRFLSALIH